MQLSQWKSDSSLECKDRRKGQLKRFDSWLGDKEEPTVSDCIEFVEHISEIRSSGTAKNYKYAVMDYMYWLKKQDAENPGDYEDAAKAKNILREEIDISHSYEMDETNYLTREQVQDIFSNTWRVDYEILWRLMYYGAMRVGEAINITWEDLDLRNGRIQFYPEKKEDPDLSHLDIDSIPELSSLIEEYKNKERVTPQGDFFNFQDRTARDRLSQITEERCSTFDSKFGKTKAFRHSFASHLRQDGVEMEVIRELLRHEHTSTTRDIYARHVDDQEVREIDLDRILTTEESESSEDNKVSEIVKKYKL